MSEEEKERRASIWDRLVCVLFTKSKRQLHAISLGLAAVLHVLIEIIHSPAMFPVKWVQFVILFLVVSHFVWMFGRPTLRGRRRR